MFLNAFPKRKPPNNFIIALKKQILSAKVQIKNDSKDNFDGFFFCVDIFRNSRMTNNIDKTLGVSIFFAICKSQNRRYISSGFRLVLYSLRLTSEWDCSIIPSHDVFSFGNKPCFSRFRYELRQNECG